MSSKTPSKSLPAWFWSSITGKLTLLYTLSASAMVVICAAFLYWVLIHNLDRLTEQFLAGEIHDLSSILRERPNDQRAIEDEINYEGADQQFPWYYARILDETGRTLIESHEMGEVMEPSVFPSPSDASQSLGPTKKWRATDGRLYQMATEWITVGHSGGQRRLVQVALDVSREDAMVADFRRKLILVSVVGICVSAGVGVTVARLGMRPLSEITSATQRIRSTQLHERIGAGHWPQELITLVAAFNEMLSRLENSFTRLSQFSADLAHELRTPINNLMGEAEVALSKTRTAEEYRQVIESSLEEMDRLSRLIDSLLFLARAENPETKIAPQRFDARMAINAVREFHNAVAQEQGVEILCEGMGEVSADPALFRQAVSNLLSNALQYTPRGGQVTISVAQHDHQWFEVTVSDTGLGIEPEHLPKIFDRFYRADQSRTRRSHGSGLGLAIVKSIMSLHSGEATVASTTGQGTTVRLRFP
jgi:two-component system heavy metal sensor histidine kinase CusS